MPTRSTRVSYTKLCMSLELLYSESGLQSWLIEYHAEIFAPSACRRQAFLLLLVSMTFSGLEQMRNVAWKWKWKLFSRVLLFVKPWTDHTAHGILQARILEWVAVPFSRGSFQPRDQIHIAGGFFTNWATRKCCLGISFGLGRMFHLDFY